MSIDPISAALDFGGKLLDRFVANPAEKAAAQLELAKMAQTGALAELTAQTGLMQGQVEVNKEEAKSSNLFVAGWRPAIGWICGAGLGYEFVVRPFLIFIPSMWGAKVDAPELAMGDLMALLTGMLGLSVSRTVEKAKGVATSVGGMILTPVKPTEAPAAPQDADNAVTAPVTPVKRKGWFG